MIQGKPSISTIFGLQATYNVTTFQVEVNGIIRGIRYRQANSSQIEVVCNDGMIYDYKTDLIGYISVNSLTGSSWR